jgi:hypothetical protein
VRENTGVCECVDAWRQREREGGGGCCFHPLTEKQRTRCFHVIAPPSCPPLPASGCCVHVACCLYEFAAHVGVCVDVQCGVLGLCARLRVCGCVWVCPRGCALVLWVVESICLM